MRVANWDANKIFKEVEESAIDAANELMDEVAFNAAARCPVGTMTKEGKWENCNRFVHSFQKKRKKDS